MKNLFLLPIRENIFGKLIFDAIYEYLCENQLLTLNQSGFRPGDSTVNQLLSIIHKIYSAFEELPSRETRAIFLDISKAFEKICSSIALGGFGTLWSKIWKSKTVLKTPSEKNGNYIFSSNSWKSIAFFRKKDFAVLPP